MNLRCPFDLEKNGMERILRERSGKARLEGRNIFMSLFLFDVVEAPLYSCYYCTLMIFLFLKLIKAIYRSFIIDLSSSCLLMLIFFFIY